MVLTSAETFNPNSPFVYGGSGIRHTAYVALFDDIRKIYEFNIKFTACAVLYTICPIVAWHKMEVACMGLLNRKELIS